MYHTHSADALYTNERFNLDLLDFGEVLVDDGELVPPGAWLFAGYVNGVNVVAYSKYPAVVCVDGDLIVVDTLPTIGCVCWNCENVREDQHLGCDF